MSDFFTSPQEKGAHSLFDMAMGGTSPWDSLISQRAGLAKTGIEQGASRAIGQGTADILSQGASMGIAPGTGLLDVANKSASGIRSGAIEQTGKVDIAALGDQINSIMQELQMGYGGLSQASGAGNWLGGLTALANIFSGVAAGGSKSQGMGFWGKK